MHLCKQYMIPMKSWKYITYKRNSILTVIPSPHPINVLQSIATWDWSFWTEFLDPIYTAIV